MAVIGSVVGVAALVAVVLLATSAGGSSGSYTIRAIFDDAGNIIPGEQVKIDGVTVGSVGSVAPTPRAQAAVVLNISSPGFQDFRADASCAVEPGGLLALEIGHGQRDAVAALLAGWNTLRFVDDLQQIPRTALARKPQPQSESQRTQRNREITEDE